MDSTFFPKIIAHRGANRLAPQNTMPAFETAVNMGVDGFETDVHLTSDGEIVLCHNYTIDETSDGSGRIEDMTLAELKEHDFGSYFSPDFAGTRIPTLAEFLEFCADRRDKINIINIEIKPPLDKETGIAAATVEAVKRFGLFDELLISSFDHQVLLDCKACDPACRTGYLYPTTQPIRGQSPVPTLAAVKRTGCDAVHPISMLVNRAYIERMHKNGLAVNVWTVNDGKAIMDLTEWGADGIISDMPDKVNLYKR
ncbi:MAG: glycerophosphodiester phosphodiesterase [Clostridiales bacterium]|nr:glycerophosphodiester phosphodiesterase [Clostridiales bacterium]